MLTLRLEQQQALALQYHERFRQQVIDHVRSKIRIRAEIKPEALDGRLQEAFQDCSALLDTIDQAPYTCYVKLTTAFFFVPHEPRAMSLIISQYLRDPRVHPITKANCAYAAIRAAFSSRSHSAAEEI